MMANIMKIKHWNMTIDRGFQLKINTGIAKLGWLLAKSN
jgi:hypothetical protein